jgi:hypothetical protein
MKAFYSLFLVFSFSSVFGQSDIAWVDIAVKNQLNDSKNRPIEIIWEKLNPNTETLEKNSKEIRSYSSHSVIKTELVWDNNSNNWVNKKEIRLEGKGANSTKKVFSWDNISEAWIPARKVSRNPQDVNSRTVSKWNNELKNWNKEFEYLVSKDSKEEYEVEIKSSKSDWQPKKKVQTIDLEDGKSVTQFIWDVDLQDWSKFSQNKTTKTDLERIQMFSFWDKYYQDWIQVKKIHSVLNEKGKVQESIIYHKQDDDSWQVYRKRTIDYSDDGIEVRIKTPNVIESQEKTIAEQNINSEMLPTQFYAVCANPYKGGSPIRFFNTTNFENFNVGLIDVQGRMVFKKSLNGVEGSFDITGVIDSGFYTLVFFNSNVVLHTKKLIIENAN